MEPNTWTKQSLARQSRLENARGYDERWAHLGAATASPRRSAVRHVPGVSFEHVQTISAVRCADCAASLSAMRRYGLLVFGATPEGDDVARAPRDRPQVHRDRESVEPMQSFLQGVSR